MTQLTTIPAPPRVTTHRSLLLSLAIGSAVYAVLRLFSGFSFYDDEGSLILMSRWLLEGHSVYGEFSSIYGPFYFLYQWTAHTLLGGATSHTLARLVAVVPWAGTCVFAFAYVLATTRSRAVALLTWLAVLRTLAFLAAEPGHPQEICILLMVGLLVAALRLTHLRLALSGALLAALTLTKINLGVFCAAGFILAVANELPVTRRGRGLLAGSVGAACAAGPLVLMLPLSGEPWVRACCALFTLSILLVAVVTASQRSQGNLAWSHLQPLVAGFFGCATVVLAWSVAHGGSLEVMLRATLLENLKLSHSWSVPLELGATAVISCAASSLVALLWLAGVRGRAFDWLRVAVGGCTLILITANRPEQALALGLPFVWMVLPADRQAPSSLQWHRNLLAAITVIQAVSVYPVAGSQLRFALVFVAISSGWTAHMGWTALIKEGIWSGTLVRRAGQAVIVLALAGYVYSAVSALTNYLRLSPLQLPGTYGVHIDQGQRANYHWVVSSTRKNSCDSLISFPAMHSVYLWTGMVPPVYPDVDGWRAYENAARQSIERRVLSSPHACVLYVDQLARFWLPHGEGDQLTLLGFIRSNFTEADEHNGFHLLVRRN